ncbi:MAG: right-handed parallel beta-helix repeat-containing protein [Verrucomicrobiota bacterium]|nr:right-handed parallel beta-helix repeat-containing protein [Verrucomicrobiota bacterium]
MFCSITRAPVTTGCWSIVHLFGRSAAILGGVVGLFVLASPLAAVDIHVANGGADTAEGTAIAPLATVAAGISKAVAGDRVLLLRGDTFREGALSQSKKITLSAYGDAAEALPIISGSMIVTGFTPYNQNAAIYTSTVKPGGSGVQQVYVNGRFCTLARYPNTGWLRTENGSDHNTIVTAALKALPTNAAGYWVGAQVRWRKWSWWYETRPITADDGNGKLSLGGSTSLSIYGNDSGYYIDNTLKQLDAPGEWYWDSASGKLYIYPPTDVDPATMLVEVAYRPTALTVTAGTLDGVAIHHYTGNAVTLNSACTVRNCLIEHVGDTAIVGNWGAAGCMIANNTIRDILNVGISWNENPSSAGGTIMERNTLLRIGNVNGLGGSGSWHAAGIILINGNSSGKGVIVRLNRITETGYAGIILGREFQTVTRNVFLRCMNTLNDGAAIYTNCNKSIITENIILDTIGDMESAQPFIALGHGIWPEFLSEFRDTQIIGNTVYGSGGNGLFLPNNYTCTVRDNVFLSNRSASIKLEGEDTSGSVLNQNHVFTNNVIGIGARKWVRTRPENVASWGTTNDVGLSFNVYSGKNYDYGSFSGTTFLTVDGLDLIRDSSNSSYTLASWKSSDSDWADPAPVAVQGLGFLFANDTETSVDFPLPANITWTQLDGTAAGSTVTLEPFRSVVLLAASGDSSALPGYFLASALSALQSYADWAVGKGLVGAQAAVDADPDGDGIQNRFEYIFNLSPLSTDTVPMHYHYSAVDGPTFRYRRLKNLPAATVVVQTSTDLVNWSDVIITPTNESIIPEESDATTDMVAVEVPQEETLFIRIQAR